MEVRICRLLKFLNFPSNSYKQLRKLKVKSILCLCPYSPKKLQTTFVHFVIVEYISSSSGNQLYGMNSGVEESVSSGKTVNRHIARLLGMELNKKSQCYSVLLPSSGSGHWAVARCNFWENLAGDRGALRWSIEQPKTWSMKKMKLTLNSS